MRVNLLRQNLESSRRLVSYQTIVLLMSLSLNAITALLRRDPRLAETTLVALSDLLRLTLSKRRWSATRCARQPNSRETLESIRDEWKALFETLSNEKTPLY